MIAQQAGNPWLKENDQGDLHRARRAAVLKCLQDKGIIRPGGVEQVIPPH